MTISLALLKRFWYVLPILAMAGYCLALRGQVSSRDASIGALKEDRVRLEERNGVTQASLDVALGRIAQQNAIALARAERFQADVAGAKADEARMAERYRSTASTVARLEASARDTSQDPCSVSDEAQNALKEL